MNETPETLVERAKIGDFAAASELIDQTYATVYAYFRRLCGSDQDAADLTQKTFVKVWQSLLRYTGRSSVKTWIHSIAHHVYVDWCRQPRRAQFETQDWWEACVADGPSPLDSAMQQDSARHIYAAVEQLDPEQRETVVLHYYQGLTILQTAEALDIATSTVKYRLRIALELLQARLSEPKIPA